MTRRNRLWEAVLLLTLCLGTVAPPVHANSGSLAKHAARLLGFGGETCTKTCELGRLAGVVDDAARRQTVLVVHPTAWEAGEVNRLRAVYPHVEFVILGSKTSEQLGLARAIALRDMPGYVTRLETTMGGRKIDGVIGTQDFPSSLLAAGIGERLDVPVPTLESMLRLTHKYHSRQLQAAAAPEAVPPFELVPPTATAIDMAPPFILKPVKGSSSAKTHKIEDPSEIVPALKHTLWEKVLYGTYNGSYDGLLFRNVEGAVTSHNFIAEGLLEGVQVTVDGYVVGGRVAFRGVVDSIMYPGTNSFARFQYPSVLPPAVLNEMQQVSARVVREAGLDNNLFNIEFFYDSATGKIGIIEVNPRMSSQFADLYEKVDGTNLFEDQIAIALGQAPTPAFRAGPDEVAASFVVRRFPGQKIVSLPTKPQLQEVRARYPEARIAVFKVEDKMRALAAFNDPSSELVAYINIGAADDAALQAKYKQILDELDLIVE